MEIFVGPSEATGSQGRGNEELGRGFSPSPLRHDYVILSKLLLPSLMTTRQRDAADCSSWKRLIPRRFRSHRLGTHPG
jgi:hypothetical protein